MRKSSTYKPLNAIQIILVAFQIYEPLRSNSLKINKQVQWTYNSLFNKVLNL